MKFFTTLITSLVLLFGGPAESRVLPIDPGGNIIDRLQMMQIIEDAGIEYHIDGVCISACTMFLGLQKVCMEPDSMLAFHSAAVYDENGEPKMSAFGNQILMLVYPKEIRDWIIKHKALESLSLTTMTSEEAYILGVKRCEDGS